MTSFLCGRRTKRCRNCAHRYPKSEYELWNCPECGEPRACTRPVSEEGKACRYHGGKTPKGIESPHYQGKGYSRYMPSSMMKKYEQFATSQDLLTLEEEIAVARTLLANRLERGLSTEAWDRAGEAYQKVMDSVDDPDALAENLSALGDVLEHGRESAEGEEKAVRLMESVRRNVDTQRQIFVDKGQLVAQSAVLMMWDAILQGIREHVAPLPGGSDAVREIAKIIGRFTGVGTRSDERFTIDG